MSARGFLPLISLTFCFLCNIFGCAATGTERVAPANDFAGERVPAADPASVRSAAARALKQYFRVDNEVSSSTRLVTLPAETSGRGERSRVRDVLTLSPNRQRRIAEVRMTQENSGVLVQCRIEIQRLDTTERAAFAAERGDDRPNQIAVERRESAARAREEWASIGRDREMEREILDTIKNQFAATQPAR